MNDINPYIWYGNRKLDYTPAHFVRSHVSVGFMDNTISSNEECIEWIYNNLFGRFSFLKIRKQVELNASANMILHDFDYIVTVPCFEDPKDCMLFNLKWG